MSCQLLSGFGGGCFFGLLLVERSLSDETSGCEFRSLEESDLGFSFTPDSVIESKKGSVCRNSWYITVVCSVLFGMVEKDLDIAKNWPKKSHSHYGGTIVLHRHGRISWNIQTSSNTSSMKPSTIRTNNLSIEIAGYSTFSTMDRWYQSTNHFR